MKGKILGLMVMGAVVFSSCVLSFDTDGTSETTTPDYKTTEVEPNDSYSLADLINTGSAAACRGAINDGTDEDWFKVTLTANQSYIFETYQPSTSSNPVDTIIEVFKQGNMSQILRSDDDDGVGYYSKTDTYTADQSVTYYIRVYGKSTSTGDYYIKVY